MDFLTNARIGKGVVGNGNTSFDPCLFVKESMVSWRHPHFTGFHTGFLPSTVVPLVTSISSHNTFYNCNLNLTQKSEESSTWFWSVKTNMLNLEVKNGNFHSRFGGFSWLLSALVRWNQPKPRGFHAKPWAFGQCNRLRHGSKGSRVGVLLSRVGWLVAKNFPENLPKIKDPKKVG